MRTRRRGCSCADPFYHQLSLLLSDIPTPRAYFPGSPFRPTLPSLSASTFPFAGVVVAAAAAAAAYHAATTSELQQREQRQTICLLMYDFPRYSTSCNGRNSRSSSRISPGRHDEVCWYSRRGGEGEAAEGAADSDRGKQGRLSQRAD